jgi:methionyl-tRNA formyltransferase
LATLGADLVVKTLRAFAAGNILPLKQADKLATYADKLVPEDFVVDWSLPALEVSNHVRGLSPSPGAVTSYKQKKIKPLFAKTIEGKGAPGEILDVTKKGITVACGEGSVLVTRLKPEGKGEMTAHAFSLGHNVAVGEVWGE